MKIPSTLRVGKKQVEISPLKSHQVHGRCYPCLNAELALIQVVVEKRKEKAISETFWHELTHMILHDMKDPRWADEKFVTAFSKRLNQAVRSAKFEE